jgi:metal-sulfur cluster biosynthetic enzyme
VSEAGNPAVNSKAGVSNGAPAGELREEMIWAQLKTVRDPELPVNVVDLGLIYELAVQPAEDGGKRIELRMTLTAPGCAMSDVIKREIETKLARLPEVSAVRVEIVFDPPWKPSMMSEAAKLATGMDFGPPVATTSGFKILR